MRNVLSVVGVVLLLAGIASAGEQPRNVSLTKSGNIIEARVTGGFRLNTEGIELIVDGTHRARPIEVTTFTQSDEPIALMFVMDGTEMFAGNLSWQTDPNAQYVGWLDWVVRGVEGLDLAHRLPKGSVVGLITYSSNVRVRQPLSPSDQFLRMSFGSQSDYRGEAGTEVEKALEMGVSALETVTTSRKMLIVIGEAVTDSKHAAARRALGQRARQANIGTMALFRGEHYEEWGFCDAWTVFSYDGLATQLRAIFDEAQHGYYAKFDVRDLPVWDGKRHELTLGTTANTGSNSPTIAVVATPSNSVTMMFADRRSWWTTQWVKILATLVVVGVLALVGITALIVRLKFKG